MVTVNRLEGQLSYRFAVADDEPAAVELINDWLKHRYDAFELTAVIVDDVMGDKVVKTLIYRASVVVTFEIS